ncbi:MAG: T9SS type A sorting domain-containing protein [Bacteroidales bacterium]|nr:T9SS type A sorting domain-containing protein [Bacteroidales bacterium]
MRNSTNLVQLPSGNVVFSKVKWVGLMLSLFTLLMINFNSSLAQQCGVSVTFQTSDFNGSDVTCFGATDGSVKALPIGGATFQYQYAWASNTAIPNPGNSQVWYNLSAGTYTVTVTDINMCTAVGTVTLTNPAALSITGVTHQDVTCNGEEDGSISVTGVTGGMMDVNQTYYYYWYLTGNTDVFIPGTGNSTSISNLSGDSYKIVVVDANNCQDSEIIDVFEAEGMTKTGGAITHPSCFNYEDGEIANVIMDGGVLPYSYQWYKNGNILVNETTEGISNIGDGTYTLEVTDHDGCSKSYTFNVIEPAAITANVVLVDAISCNGTNDGSLTVDILPVGGIYDIIWSGLNVNGNTNLTISNLVPGTYSVQVQDNNGCPATGSASGDPSLPGTWTYVNTGINHTFYLAAADYGMIGGTHQISAGDYLGAFVGNLCVGYAVVGADNTVLTAWANDSETGGKDGFDNGDVVEFRLFRPLVDEFVMDNATFEVIPGTVSNGTFYEEGASVLNGLSFQDVYPTSSIAMTLTQPSVLMGSAVPTHVSCNGDEDGSINLTVSGGTSPYTFVWSLNGLVTEDISDLDAGNYIVTITDHNNCETTANATITQPAILSFNGSATITDVACHGLSTGIIQAPAIAGGTSPYTYLWSNAATTSSVTGLNAGTYDLTITDAHNCTITDSYDVNQPAAALAASGITTNINCFGDLSGGINLSVTGGTAPYSFAWSNVAITEDLSNVAAGSYTVTVSDDHSCTTVETFLLTQPVAALSFTNITLSEYNGYGVECPGDDNGSISVSVTGGSEPYNYSWSTGSTLNNINTLSANVSYVLTVTDNKGCTLTTSQTLTEPDALSFTNVNENVHCVNGSNGLINLTVYNGVTPYTYSWSNGQQTQDISLLVAGNYSVTVSDANDCQHVENYTITEPLAISITEDFSDYNGYNVQCNGGDNGEIELTVLGGTAPYFYGWSHDVNATTALVTDLEAGSYTVTVTDAFGCTATEIYTLDEPTAMVVQVTPSPALCNGDDNGSILVNIANAIGDVTITWNGGGPVTIDELNNDSYGILGLSAGTYTVTVQDENTCSAGSAVAATPTGWDYVENTGADHQMIVPVGGLFEIAPGIPVQNGDYLGVFFDDNGDKVCGGFLIYDGVNNSFAVWGDDIFTIEKDGFLEGEAFVWKIFRPFAGEFDAFVTYAPIGGSVFNTNLFETDGTSAITAMNSNIDYGEVNITTAVVSEPEVLEIVSMVAPLIQCHDEVTSITANVEGGTLPYTFTWSGDASITSAITNKIAGTYDVTVTDANACTAIAQKVVNNPDAIVFTIDTDDVLCYGDNTGSAVIATETGGYAPYTYTWEAGPATLAFGTYHVTLTDAQGCTEVETFNINQPDTLVTTAAITHVLCNTAATGQIVLTTIGGTAPYDYEWSVPGNTNTISNLVAGSYSVTVEDFQGCLNIHTIAITQPDPISISQFTISDYNGYGVKCNTSTEGFVNITPAGGVAPYSYEWSDGQTTQNAINLAGGLGVVYDVTITDHNSCTFTSQSYAITAPDALSADAIVTSSFNTNIGGPFNTSCNGLDGEAEVAANGGVGNYSYEWSNGDLTTEIDGLAGGTYTVTVTDANACTITDVITVTTPGPVNVEINHASDYNGFDVACYGGSNGGIQLDWDGGVGEFDIYWVNWGNNSNLNIANQTITVNTFPAGTFYAVIVDANGCAAQSSTITLDQPTEITLPNPAAFAPTCHNGNDAYIDITNITGGFSDGLHPYTASWFFPSNIPFSLGLVHTGLSPDITYTGQVTDGNNCSKLIYVTTPNISEIEVSNIAVTDVLCNGASTGEITADVIGGHGNYTFGTNFAGPYTANETTGLAAGTYTLYVRDAQNCTVNVPNIVVEENSLIVPTEAITHVACNGEANGAITITTLGGIAPYSYIWAAPVNSTNSDIAGLIAGDYTVTITDSESCERSFTYTVTEPDVLEITAAIEIDANCYNAATGQVALTLAGGTLPYTYAWSNGADAATNSNLVDGSYTVTVTDAHNCTVTGTYTITEPADYTFVGSTTTNVSCNGVNDGAINLSIQGGTGIIGSFGWSNLETTEDLANLIAGTYTVTFDDANGCDGTTEFTITEPDELEVSLIKTDITCNNYNDGTINATIVGGTEPYIIKWNNILSPEDLMGLAAGVYDIEIVDAHSCVATASITINNPAAILLSADITPVACFQGNTGEIEITVTNGVGQLTYAWTGSASTSAIAENLEDGTYAVTVTDAGNCFASLEGLIVVEPTQLTSSVQVIEEQCVNSNDGMALVTGLGGNDSQNYTYVWSMIGAGTTDTESGIEPGTYSVTVSDYKGCTSASVFTIDAAVPMSLSLTAIDASCENNTTGSVSVLATGGTEVFDYEWSNGSLLGSTGAVGTGTYFVTVTDGNGCTATGSKTVEADFYFNFDNAVSSPVSCNQDADGSILVNFDNSQAEHYSFQWYNANHIAIGGIINNAFTTTLANQAAGDYFLVVTAYPANACSKEYSFSITEPDELLISNYNITDANCYKTSDGAIDITVTGGNGGNTYKWIKGANFIGTNQDITGLRAANYQVIVTDSKGCSVIGQAVVGQPDFLTTSFANTNVSCFNAGNGLINLSVIGGTAPFTYAWGGGITTEDRSNLAPGAYNVVVTDINGCTTANTITITQPAILAVTDISQSIENCDEVTLQADVTGGTLPYYFSWADNNAYAPLLSQNETMFTDNEDVYYLKVVDGNGCVIESTEIVDLPTHIGVNITQTHNNISNVYGAIANVTNGAGGTTYSWNTGSTLSVIANLNVGSTYTVTVTDMNGCEDTDDIQIVAVMITDNTNTPDQDVTYLEGNDLILTNVVVYPNPSANGIFTVQVDQIDLSHSFINVVDALGRIVSASITSKNSQVEISIPATVGVYYLHIITESNALITKQLIISE